MKAERRHELETNDLAKKIIQAPDYFKLYGGRIAMAIVVLAAIAMLVNYRIRSNRDSLAAAQRGISDARDAVARLAMTNLAAGAPAELASQRQQLISAANQSIETVNEKSDDAKLLAQAAMLRGDLYWTIANLAALPGAATQPSLAVETKPEDALAQADAAYRRVIESYPGQTLPATTARFGLAAIAENRGQWDEARKQYEAVNADPNAAAAFKAEAETRLHLVSQLQKGVYLASKPAPATTLPAASPATTVPGH